MTNATQRQWIHKLYDVFKINISKITHADRDSKTKKIEKLDIDVNQIQRADHWADDSMHKNYLTNLSRAFMRDMIEFQSEYADIYFISRDQVQSSNEFLQMIFSKLNYWIQQKIDDIVTRQFLRLLVYLRIVFLQNSVFHRTQYFEHFLWHLNVFQHSLYIFFAIDVIVNLKNKNQDMNSQIRTIISILDQQMLNLNVSFTSMLIEDFKNQHQQTIKMKSKLNDFLKSKIVFTMTSIKRQKLFQFNTIVKNSKTIQKNFIFIDSRLLFFFSFTIVAVFTVVISLCFVSSSKKIFFARFKIAVARAIISSSVYQLSRIVHIVSDLHKKWTQNIGIDSSVNSMNEQYGDAWRKSWKSSEREFYFVRKIIITHVREQVKDEDEQSIAWSIEAKRASKDWTLNMLSKSIRKGYKVLKIGVRIASIQCYVMSWPVIKRLDSIEQYAQSQCLAESKENGHLMIHESWLESTSKDAWRAFMSILGELLYCQIISIMIL